MFKLLKLFLWLGVIVILAYFMADIKIGGKSLKQNIDDLIRSKPGVTLKNRGNELFKKHVRPQLIKVIESTESGDKSAQKTGVEDGNEGIRDKDNSKLEKIIQKNQ